MLAMQNNQDSLYDVGFRAADKSADRTSESDGGPMASNPQRNVGDKIESEIISISARTEPTTRDRSAGSGYTGPRTEVGKKISSRNAFKHGIFSEVTVLQGESRKKYASLLHGLRQALKPDGEAEEILVEKLAVLSWRLRRLLLAESAGIRAETENIRFGQQNDKLKASHGMSRSALFGDSAFIEEIHNPNVLE